MVEAQNLKYGEGREALLAATVSVVAERGLRGLTFRATAERANVNNTLISHHFGTKSALLSESVEWAAERALRLSDLVESGPLDPGFANRLVSFVAAEPELQLFQYQIALESRLRPDLRAKAVRLYEGYIDAVEHLLGRAGFGKNRPLARAVFASIDGLVFQQLTVADEATSKEAMGYLRGLLIAASPQGEFEQPMSGQN